MPSGEISFDCLKIEKALFSAGNETLSLVSDSSKEGSYYLLQTLRFPSSSGAAKALEVRRSWQNALSLNPHPAFLAIIEIEQRECVLNSVFEGHTGNYLPQYIKDYFKGYPAEEGFALELAYHLVEMVRALVTTGGGGISMGKIRPGDIFISESGKIRVLPFFMESADPGFPRQMLEGCAELLYGMLTLEEPRREHLIASRVINREITEAAEIIIRRCALPEKDGGYGNILSLRQALYKELKPEEHPLKDGHLRGFKSEKPLVDYREHLKEAVTEELSFLERLKRFDFGRDYRFMVNLLKNAHKHFNSRRLWPLLILPYLVVLLPFLFYVKFREQEIDVMPLAIGILITFPLYVMITLAILTGGHQKKK